MKGGDIMSYELNEYMEYIEKLPTNRFIESIKESDLELHIFDAYEDITSLYPSIKPTPRMIYKQIEFKVEAEQSGIGYMSRQGITNQRINDASVEIDASIISPYVLDLIHNELGHHKLSIGRLI